VAGSIPIILQSTLSAYRRAKNIKDSVVQSDISQGANKTSLLHIPPATTDVAIVLNASTPNV
jgi:hypothetical protein